MGVGTILSQLLILGLPGHSLLNHSLLKRDLEGESIDVN
jgi:hypothetical protein